ncbi:hypothetical protein ANACOL_02746 [Anaerotruncus colihominis DSM 17241]|uniref:Uncharacterized protein n=1 Tax=Anaerotruncus colihominis DSM 17241 TaxID=445972 RepID=B0PDW1_9FIRM|nr:hypothetical protein ANACOL_02746 [Anaerotruncus colihominis DSM 17241]
MIPGYGQGDARARPAAAWMTNYPFMDGVIKPYCCECRICAMQQSLDDLSAE